MMDYPRPGGKEFYQNQVEVEESDEGVHEKGGPPKCRDRLYLRECLP